jgi:hypothetical protein
MKLRGMKILSRKNENSLIDSTWDSMICKKVAVSFLKKGTIWDTRSFSG